MDGSDGSLALPEGPGVELLLEDIDCFLKRAQAGAEILEMDRQIAEVLSLEDYQLCARYKQISLEELGQRNQTPGPNAVLRAGIERGFILGYWLAMQRFEQK